MIHISNRTKPNPRIKLNKTQMYGVFVLVFIPSTNKCAYCTHQPKQVQLTTINRQLTNLFKMSRRLKNKKTTTTQRDKYLFIYFATKKM